MEFSLPASRTAFPFERLLILQLIIFSPQLFAQQKGRVFPFFFRPGRRTLFVAGIFCQKQLFNARFLGFAFLYSLVRRIKYLIYQVLALPIIKFHSEECGWGS